MDSEDFWKVVVQYWAKCEQTFSFSTQGND